MKINIHRVSLILTSFVAVFSITLGFMTRPVNATITCYNPKNWIEDVVYDGNMKTVKYHISGNQSYFDVHYYSNNTTELTEYATFAYDEAFAMTPPAEASKTKARIYVLGKYTPIGVSLPDYSSVYVGDFKVGAEVDINLQYKATVKLLDILSPYCGVTWTTYLYRYRSDGSFIQNAKLEQATVTFTESSGTVNIDSEYAYERKEDDFYIVPVIEISFSHAYNTDGVFEIELRPWDFRFTVAVNMIEENSQTMQDINDKLGDISDQIGDTNEKLDDILSGGSAGSSLNGTTGAVNDKNEELGDTLQDYQDVQESLPTTPDNFDDIVDNKRLDDAIENAEQVFDWDASGLANMFPPMGVSVGLSTLFYVVFGKRG